MNKHKGKIISENGKYRVIDCTICAYKHIEPMPTEQELDQFYSVEFYESFWGDYIQKNLRDKEWLNIQNMEKYDFFESVLPKARRRVLDIGSGPGFFLELGKSQSWIETGLEPGRAAYAFSKELGLNIHNCFFNSKNYSDFGEFDVVHMNNVLEHIPDPMAMLNMCYKIIDDGGLICITSPNDYNPFQLAIANYTGKKQWWFAPEEHVNYFNKNTLTKLLEKAGFTFLKGYTSFPLEMFYMMGDDYLTFPEKGSEIHEKRKNFEIFMDQVNPSLKMKLYEHLADIDIGREITIIAVKN
jgi:SAM-dependent methyltransferase